MEGVSRPNVAEQMLQGGVAGRALLYAKCALGAAERNTASLGIMIRKLPCLYITSTPEKSLQSLTLHGAFFPAHLQLILQ